MAFALLINGKAGSMEKLNGVDEQREQTTLTTYYLVVIRCLLVPASRNRKVVTTDWRRSGSDLLQLCHATYMLSNLD